MENNEKFVGPELPGNIVLPDFINFEVGELSFSAVSDILSEVKSSISSCEKRYLREYLDLCELKVAEKILTSYLEELKK